MSDFRVASRYAKSFLELSIELKVLDESHASMQLIWDVCKENPKFVRLLINPIIRYDYKLRIIRRIFEDKVNELSSRFMELLCKKGREGILPEIAKVFLERYNDYKGIVIAEVESAAPLTDDLRKAFRTMVGHDKNEVILEEQVREELIGGFILTIGDRQLDNSLSTKLNKLRREFKGKKVL